MTESIQITELSMKDYEFVNRAYHVLHKEHVNGRPDIYVERNIRKFWKVTNMWLWAQRQVKSLWEL